MSDVTTNVEGDPPSDPAPPVVTKEEQFTDALMAMVAEYLANHNDPNVNVRLQRLDENRFAYRYGNEAMSITANEITDVVFTDKV